MVKAKLDIPDMGVYVKPTLRQRINRLALIALAYLAGTITGLTAHKLSSIADDINLFFSEHRIVSVSELEIAIDENAAYSGYIPRSENPENLSQSYIENNVPGTVKKVSLSEKPKYIIYCDKYTNTTRLYEAAGNTVVEIYSCRHTDGRGGSGPKKLIGDNRTIEDVCSLKYITFRSNSFNNPLYGDAVIGLSSEFDRMVLCGTDYEERIAAIRQKRDVTLGCPVLLNKDISFIANRILLYMESTKVIIENSQRPLRI